MTNSHRSDAVDEAFTAISKMPIPERPLDTNLLDRLMNGNVSVNDRLWLSQNQFSQQRSLLRVMLGLSFLVAVVLGLSFLFSGSASVALADVIEEAEKHKLVKYTRTETSLVKDGSSTEPTIKIAYADLQLPRFRTQHGLKDSLMGAKNFDCVFITDQSKNVRVRIITEEITEEGKNDPKLIKLLESAPPRKLITLWSARGDHAAGSTDSSKSVLENLLELEKHKDAIAIKGKLNGMDVLKYRIEEEHQTILLIVNPATKLPMRVEHEITDPNVLRTERTNVIQFRFVLSDFEWDPDLNGKTLDELFDTIPPEGYKVEDQRQ